MKWIKTTAVTAGFVVLAAVATVAVVKLRGPQIKDAYFDPDTDKLRLLPANLVVARATHFPHAAGKVRHLHDSNDSVTRTLGRDVSLRQAIAEAWDCNPARVQLPPDAPKGGVDFLITTTATPREHLQTAIRKQFGYIV